MSVIVETTKLIAEHLQSLLPDCIVRRSYLPMSDIEELNDAGKPVLLVVAFDRDAEKYTQGGQQKNTLTIDIIANAKLQHRNDEPEALNAEIDGYIATAETIYSAFLKKIMKSQEGFQLICQDPEHLILNDFESIQERNCFLSSVRINAEVYCES